MIEKIKELLDSKKILKIRELFEDFPLTEILDSFETLDANDRTIFFRILTTTQQSTFFAALDYDLQLELVKGLTDNEVKAVINDMYSDELADLIEELPSELSEKVLSLVTDEDLKEGVNQILEYDEDAVGAIMHIDFVKIYANWTVTKTLDMIAKHRDEIRIHHYLFVSHIDDKIAGYIALEDLILAKGTTPIKKILKPVPIIYANMPQEEAATIFADNDMSTLPVVDMHDRMVGIMSADEVIDVLSKSADEDMSMQAGILYNEKPYMKTKVRESYRDRVIWLLILMVAMTFISMFLEIFEHNIINRFGQTGSIISVALMIIIPVVMDTAGNAGGQSSALIIRDLATGELKPKDYLKVMGKELIISSLVGLTIGVFNVVRLIVYYYAVGILFDENGLYIWITLSSSIALMLIVIIAKIIGALVPLLAKKIKLDPAMLSGPITTSVIDVMATVLLFALTTWILIIAWV